MGLEEYFAGKTVSSVGKVTGKVKRTARYYLNNFEDSLPAHLSEEEYQHMQTCVSLLVGLSKLYKTGDETKCSNYWTSHGYVLVDPSQFPDFDAEMRREMTSEGNHQVAVFRKGESNNYVIAARGTKNFKDLCTDFLCLGEVLHKDTRVDILERIVRALVTSVGAQNVILTGHSLGGGVGIIVGQRLHLANIKGMKEFYFNPPYGSSQRLVSELLSSFKIEMYVAKNIIDFLKLSKYQAKLCEILKRGVARALGYDLNGGPEMDRFLRLRDWHPYICINTYDRICNGFFCFFKRVESLSAGPTTTLNDVPPLTSVTHILQAFRVSAEPRFLFPSANLIITDKGFGTLVAHPLKRWHGLERSRITYKQVRGFSRVIWPAPV